MDKALETTYTMRGVTRVVRTEPTGIVEKTQAKHTKACLAAVAELTDASRPAWLAEIDAELAPLNRPERYQNPYTRREREERKAALTALRRRVAGKSFAITPPKLDDWRKALARNRNFKGETVPAVDIEPYRTAEPASADA